MRNYKKNVDDTSSTPVNDSDNLASSSPFIVPCCHFCGKTGVIVEHFPRRGYGGRYSEDVIEALNFHGGQHDP